MAKRTDELEKLPPQNIEAEQSVLGALLIDKDAIIKVADIVKPTDFYKDIHKTIFEAMFELYEKQEPIDILSLVNRLEEKSQLEEIGGRTYLATLANSVPTATNVASYAQIVQRKATLRKLIHTSSEISNMAFQEEEEIAKILDKAEHKLFAVSQRYLKQNFIPIQSVLGETFDRIDELHKQKGVLRGLPTGFKDLDNILAGFQKSNLVILAGRPSTGKSALALDLARHASVNSKVPVGIFSLEMSKEEIVDRLLCAQAGVNLWKMRTGHLSDSKESNDFPRIGEGMSALSEAPIFIDDSPIANILEVKTKARRLCAEYNLGLIILDYLQLMEAERESRVQEVSEISRGLKAIARELNVPLIAVSQLSRGVESRTPPIPKLSDLRESGCLTGDTLITRADTGERIPIEELTQRKRQKAFPVMAAGEDWKVSPRQMVKVFSSGKKIVFELKTASGRKIKASANHPFLKLKRWTRLDKLNTGNYIATSHNPSPSKISWDKIVSIKKLDLEEVYDATVEGAHNFVANDIIVHNSLEQDSDVVMFIYRPEIYKKDTPKQNIAEIHIAKHRNGPAGIVVNLYFDKNTASFKNLEKNRENIDSEE